MGLVPGAGMSPARNSYKSITQGRKAKQ